MSESESGGHETQKDLVKILTEDIQSHRDYIHRLYRSAFIAGFVLVSILIGFGYWILGKQLDSKIFEYRIVESLRKQAEDISRDVAQSAKTAAQEQVTSYITERIQNEAASVLQENIKNLDVESLQEYYQSATIPTGAVVAFSRVTGCPSGWKEYIPAYGRFIRGIDKSGQNIDPDGTREPDSLQDDMFKSHNHGGDYSYLQPQGVGGASHRNLMLQGGQGTQSFSFFANGGIETRPKNVALLYCLKQ